MIRDYCDDEPGRREQRSSAHIVRSPGQGRGGPGHAAVTEMADHEPMSPGPRDPPEKAGALIVRVWLEESADPKLRIRMVGRLDLEGDDQVTAAAADIDEMLAYIREWLERFAEPGKSDSPGDVTPA